MAVKDIIFANQTVPLVCGLRLRLESATPHHQRRPTQRGWRSDCVVGGMETRFQWRKAHSRTAKCEAFHFAPRLFFMFLFLIPFTLRKQSIIYLQYFSTESIKILFAPIIDAVRSSKQLEHPNR